MLLNRAGQSEAAASNCVSVNETVMIHGVTYLVGNMSAEGSNHRVMGNGIADLRVSLGGGGGL